MLKRLLRICIIPALTSSPCWAFELVDGRETSVGDTFNEADVNDPDIDGGTIDGTTIGGSTPAPGTFTTLESSEAAPSLDLKDSDTADDDVNASIEAAATDTRSGSEDIDLYLQQQIDGTLTTFLHADADGNIDFQDRNLTTTGSVTANSAALAGGTNTFSVTNGTASLDVAAGATVNIDKSLTVDGQAAMITGHDQANTLTLYESLTVGDAPRSEHVRCFDPWQKYVDLWWRAHDSEN